MNTRSTLPALCLAALVAADFACSPEAGAPPPSPANAPATPPFFAAGQPATIDAGDADAGASTTPLPTDPALCSGGAWSAGAKVREMPASDLQSLAGITPLGRTVAWIDTNGRLLVADRTDSTAEFGDPITVDTGSPSGLAALHPVGATLFATNASRSGLVVYQRLYRKDPWTGPTTVGLDVLDAQLGSLRATIEEMTIGGTPGSLFLLLAIAGSHVLYEAPFDVRTGGWGRAVAHDEAAVASTTGKVLRPTGLSWDGRTLFVFDPSAGVTRAASRGGAIGPFASVLDVGAFPEAIPDQSCSHLYYVDHDKDGVGLFAASR